MKMSPFCSVAVGVVMAHLSASSAFAEEGVVPQGYVDVAADHCALWLSGSDANMSFVLGKAVGTLSNEQLSHFNQFFGLKLKEHYGVAVDAECELNEVHAQAVIDKNTAPPMPRDRTPKENVEEAVVSGMLKGINDVPVAVAYRLTQKGAEAPWVVQSISLNGEPVAERFRNKFEKAAASGGASAILDQL